MASKEGINRAERGGKDDKGTYGGMASGVTDPVVNNAKSAGSGAQGYLSKAGQGVKGAGGYVGSLWGGSSKKEGEEQGKEQGQQQQQKK